MAERKPLDILSAPEGSVLVEEAARSKGRVRRSAGTRLRPMHNSIPLSGTVTSVLLVGVFFVFQHRKPAPAATQH